MERDLEKRVLELSSRAFERGTYAHTQFLTEGEQAQIALLPLPVRPHFEGGFPEAERRLAVFGSVEEMGYEWEGCISILKIGPKDRKFSEDLTHRDHLGAILNLGMKREVLGDILLAGQDAYLFVLSSFAPFICENLTRVRHTAVKVTPVTHLPQDVRMNLEEREGICASDRLDGIVSAVWNLSRSEGKSLVEKERVSVGGVLTTDPGKTVLPGVRISVRGYGRFFYDGPIATTKSGRCRFAYRLYV